MYTIQQNKGEKGKDKGNLNTDWQYTIIYTYTLLINTRDLK